LLLLPELNECFLFHGTSGPTKDAIVHQGIDYRLGNHSALFGQGCYFTESSTKADQYAGKMIQLTYQRYFRVDTLKELFETVDSGNIIAFIKDINLYHYIYR